MAHAEVKEPPRLDDVATDRRVHEARKEGDAQHFGVRKIRVRPGVDAGRCLEDFQHEADEVKEADGLEFVQRFQLRPDHRGLDGDRDDEEQVVARDAPEPCARREEDGEEEESGEEAGARFF